MLAREFVASHSIKKMSCLRVPVKLTAWRRESGFDRRDVLMERQRTAGWRVFVIEESEHYALVEGFQPTLPPLPHDTPTIFGRR